MEAAFNDRRPAVTTVAGPDIHRIIDLEASFLGFLRLLALNKLQGGDLWKARLLHS